jgi:tetratricopeptide (TPR) repeat protein
MLSTLAVPDFLPHMVGILLLLLVWQYHQMQVMAGRIQAFDIFDRSGIRMYVFATPQQDQICDSCRAAGGTVFLPTRVAETEFSPLETPCTRSGNCTGALVGLYGAWLEARGVLDRLYADKKQGRLKLSPEELRGLLNGQWERSVGAATDRLGVHMLEALCYETINPDVAIQSYRYVVDQAREIRHLLLLVPAYLRLVDVLGRAGRYEEAIQAIEQFESRFPRTKRARHFPTEAQRGLMSLKKSRLKVAEAHQTLTTPLVAVPNSAATG